MKVVDVRRVGDRVMTVVADLEDDVLRLICGYAVQSGRSLEEKQSFYDELNSEWNIHSAGDLVMCLGDLNGHIGRYIDGFDGVHGCFSGGRNAISVVSLEGIMCVKYMV